VFNDFSAALPQDFFYGGVLTAKFFLFKNIYKKISLLFLAS